MNLESIQPGYYYILKATTTTKIHNLQNSLRREYRVGGEGEGAFTPLEILFCGNQWLPRFMPTLNKYNNPFPPQAC